jgi:integrase
MTKYAIVRILDEEIASPLVSDFAASFLSHRATIGKKLTTIRCSEKPTLLSFAEFCGGREVSQITDDDAGRWNMALMRRLSNESRRTKIAVMAVAWDWAVSKRWATENIFRSLKLPKKTRFAGRTLTDEEIGILLAYVTDDRVRRACLLSLYTGLRRTEVITLEHSQIRGNLLTIPAEKSKSGRERVLMLSDDALAAIGPRGKSESVFQLGLHTLNGMVTAAWRASGLGKIRFHDFRHTAITRFFEDCDDIFAAMDIFGWADPKSAVPYQHMTEKRRKKILSIHYGALIHPVRPYATRS